MARKRKRILNISKGPYTFSQVQSIITKKGFKGDAEDPTEVSRFLLEKYNKTLTLTLPMGSSMYAMLYDQCYSIEDSK